MDVTYQTLMDQNFLQQIQKLFPDVDWKQPLEEYKAAGEV